MKKIREYSFNKNNISQLGEDIFSINWPSVYILEGGKKAYVGETTRFKSRMKEHLDNPIRKKMKKAYQITDNTFNRSASSDLEAMLIEYMAADGLFELQNGNRGLRNHNYYDKESYQESFSDIWKSLIELKVALNDLRDIRNKDLFKLSPFKVLTDEQHLHVNAIENIIKNTETSLHVINGEPGSGKTVLAVYLMKYLIEDDFYKDKKIGLVVPMTSLRQTLKSVFRSIKGLQSKMILGPTDVVKEEYDLLIVDESHRLSRRKSLSSYSTFDNACRKIGKDPLTTSQLDWIKHSAKHIVLFYDKNQTVKPADIKRSEFDQLNANRYDLTSQFRVTAGSEYTAFVDAFLKQENVNNIDFGEYAFKLFDDVNDMVESIKEKNKQYGLSRNVAGYCWKWISKDDKSLFDINIQSYSYQWNSVHKDWINSKNSINEIGCIHTTQGYDLNYCGVIIGPDLIYRDGKVKYNAKAYKDKKGKDSTLTDDEMRDFIINIYKVLMTRGIRGTYIYVCDDQLREVLSETIEKDRWRNDNKAISL